MRPEAAAAAPRSQLKSRTGISCLSLSNPTDKNVCPTYGPVVPGTSGPVVVFAAGVSAMNIIPATNPEEIQTARELFREYSTWLAADLCFQNFEKELAELPGSYAPPNGRLLLAVEGDQIAGCVGLRSIGDDICEMKRLYVRQSFRDVGLGRQLLERIVAEAREIGYTKMRLDTLPGRMDRAIAMYRRLGFREIDRYYDNPNAEAMYMELDL